MSHVRVWVKWEIVKSRWKPFILDIFFWTHNRPSNFDCIAETCEPKRNLRFNYIVICPDTHVNDIEIDLNSGVFRVKVSFQDWHYLNKTRQPIRFKQDGHTRTLVTGSLVTNWNIRNIPVQWCRKLGRCACRNRKKHKNKWKNRYKIKNSEIGSKLMGSFLCKIVSNFLCNCLLYGFICDGCLARG